MNYLFALISGAGAAIAAATAVYVLARNPGETLNQLFFAYAGAVALFDLANFLMLTAGGPAAAFFFSHLSVMCWFLFLAFLLHFCLVLSGIYPPSVKRIVLPFIYLFVLFFSFFDWKRNWLYSSVKLTFFGYRTQPGTGYWALALFSTLIVLVQLTLLIIAYRSAKTKREKRQRLWLLAGLGAASFFGFFLDVILPSFGFFSQSLVPLATTLYVIALGYVIFRYGFLVISPALLAGDILNTMLGFVVFTDKQRTIRLVNQNLLQTLGYSHGDLIGQPCRMLHKDKEGHDMLHSVVAQGKMVKGMVSLLKKKDGSVIPVTTSAVKIVDDIGDELGNLFVFNDISGEQTLIAQQQETIDELSRVKARTLSILEDTVEAMNRLTKKSEDYRVLIESASDQIFMVNEELKFESMNDAALGQLGKKLDEVIGKPVSDVFPKEMSASNIHNLEIVFKTGQNLSVEEELSFGSNRVFVSSRLSPIKNNEGKTVRVLGIVRDITEHKQVEDMQRAREVADAANRAKSDFLANMSHELRTPLNSIIGFCEVLSGQAYGPMNEKQQDYLNDVLTSGQHLLSLINDILDLSKVEAGKMELALTTFSLKQLLEQSFIMIKEKALKHNIALSSEIADEIGEINADERKLKQIVYNLLSNAVKFTPDGGKIGIRARITDEQVEVAVWDTGIGISGEDQAKLFEKFTQLGGPYVEKVEGTGLGLALAKSLVELHGGKIRVESEGKDKGTTFSFTLPVKQEKGGTDAVATVS